jgi:hypothetical protein
MSLADTLPLLDDAELARYQRRAYYGAAAAWRDLNRPLPNGPYSRDDARTLRIIQYEEATQLDEWHATLAAEARRRKDAR